ncbi:MAG: glyoxalase [Pseudonocardiales bacterium]|nr:MAG: glyoxalase [Pseudonocardiales bacterium]
MTIPAIISLVTLGVRDVAAATRFYQSLGFELSSGSVEGDVSFFRTNGALLGLYGQDDLAADAKTDPRSTGEFRGVTLAINLDSRDAVDAAFAAVEAAGASIAKPPHTAEWGGYSGYFADLDGHLWEIAHNPYWPLGPDGIPRLP